MNNENQHIPVGYKSSPLGIIPEDWEVKRLGEVCDISIGRDVQINHFSEYMTNDYKYPVYSNTVEGEGLYGYYNYEEYSQGKVTVVGRGVGLGTSFARDCGFGAIGRLVVLTPKEKLSTHYLESYINNKVHFFVESAAIPQLTGEHIASYKIAIPSLSEQKKIETYIQLWDTAISKQTALIEKLILRKKGLMQQLLTGKKRLKGFEGKWKEVRLGECGKFLSNNTLSREQLNESGGIVQNIHYGDVLIKYPSIIDCSKATLPFINEFAYKESMTYFVKNGDIVIADTAEDETVGKACEVQNIGTKKILAGLHTMLFRPNEGLFSPFFLGYYINSEVYHSNLIPLIQGIKVCSIGKQAIQNTTIVIPSIDEQNAIASVLVNADKEIELAKQKLSSLQEQKKGLMQVLLTGKKRIII